MPYVGWLPWRSRVPGERPPGAQALLGLTPGLARLSGLLFPLRPWPRLEELEVEVWGPQLWCHLLAYTSERADSLVGWGMALGLDTRGQCAVPKAPASLLRDRQQGAASLPWDKWTGSKQTWPQGDHTATPTG